MQYPNDSQALQEREADLARLDARHDQETRHMPPPHMDIRRVMWSRAERGQGLGKDVMASVPPDSSVPDRILFGDTWYALLTRIPCGPDELYVHYRAEP